MAFFGLMQHWLARTRLELHGDELWQRGVRGRWQGPLALGDLQHVQFVRQPAVRANNDVLVLTATPAPGVRRAGTQGPGLIPLCERPGQCVIWVGWDGCGDYRRIRPIETCAASVRDVCGGSGRKRPARVHNGAPRDVCAVAGSPRRRQRS